VAETLEAETLDAGSRAHLLALIESVGPHGRMLLEEASFADTTFDLASGLAGLARRAGDWIRPASTWRPRSHSGRRQFAALARHRLAEYPVPAFMDAAWMRRDARAELFRDWFVRIGRGENVRTAASPVPLTKRIVHHFLRAPADYSIEHALRWGQVHAVGGGPGVVAAVLRSQLGRELGNDDFWLTVFRFLVENPAFPRRRVPLLVSYLNARKLERWAAWCNGEVYARGEPPQPHLSMTGRSVETLLRQVLAWQRGLHADGRPVGWARSGLRGFERKIASDPPVIQRVRELLSTRELLEEGRAMRNCVASYAVRCIEGHCSIWSLEEETPERIRKRQTIEVRGRLVVQSRGRGDRFPGAAEKEILCAWAQQEGLTLVDPF
jgi:hypothetical protein